MRLDKSALTVLTSIGGPILFIDLNMQCSYVFMRVHVQRTPAINVTMEHSVPWKSPICGVTQELSGRVPGIQESQWKVLDKVSALYQGLNGTMTGGES